MGKELIHMFTSGYFPGGSVLWILHFQCRGHRFDPWLRN